MTGWRATAYYRSENGLVDVTHDIEEIEDLHDLVEAGPHFDTVDHILIERIGHVDGPCLTVEAAAKL